MPQEDFSSGMCFAARRTRDVESYLCICETDILSFSDIMCVLPVSLANWKASSAKTLDVCMDVGPEIDREFD
jgi:hypothetical protein